jgi:succinate semialdehyde reductase
MNTVRIPKVINFGENALGETEYPKNALVVTTVPPALSDKWWVSRITCCMTK